MSYPILYNKLLNQSKVEIQDNIFLASRQYLPSSEHVYLLQHIIIPPFKYSMNTGNKTHILTSNLVVFLSNYQLDPKSY